MGILYGNDICEALCAKSLLFSVPAAGPSIKYEPIYSGTDPRPDANLYIDGPILLYCGNVKKRDDASDDIAHSLLIIKLKLKKIISVVATRFNIVGVHVFFDGDAPPEKAPRQAQRAMRASTYNIQEIKRAFCAYNHFPPIAINNLRHGEAEMEMYRMRDTRTTSVIYTKDTDMFTIAYGHSAEDDVIYCQERKLGDKNMYRFFDMRKFHYASIPKAVFSALMALVGTDYTETRLSLTQIKCLLEDYGNDENPNITSLLNVISDDPKIEEISALVDIIVRYFQWRRNERRGGFSHSQKYRCIKESEYLQIVLWYVRYIKNGFDTTSERRVCRSEASDGASPDTTKWSASQKASHDFSLMWREPTTRRFEEYDEFGQSQI